MGNYVTDEDREAFSTAVEDGNTDDAPDTTTPEEPAAEPENPDEGEQGTEEPVGDDEAAEEQPDAEEPEQTYPVRVDGQEVQLTLSELQNGYLRHADYTRKSQQLAADRVELDEASEIRRALYANPQNTLAVLARHFNVDLGEVEPPEDVPAGPTAEQRRLMELESWRDNELYRQREAAVDGEVARLKQVYGDFDEEQLYSYAVSNGVGNLETALRAMTYDKAGNARREVKRKAGAMAGGTGANGIVKPKPAPTSISNFRDAYEAARSELANGAA